MHSSVIGIGGFYLDRDVQSIEISGDLGIEVANFKSLNEKREVVFDGK